MSGPRLTRRQALVAAAVAGLAAGLRPGRGRAAVPEPARIDFSALGDGEGWAAGWTTVGVANLRRAGGAGVLEAGSDVFPNDPRPVAFAVDSRVRDGEIRAVMTRTGRAAGVVLRRVAVDAYYAAVYDTDQRALLLLRRHGDSLDELARASVSLAAEPLTITFSAAGSSPTRLTASLAGAQVSASDSTPALQGAGDPGVLATADTLLTTFEDAYAPFGNGRLAFFGTQEGTTFAGTPVGQAVIGQIRDRSTAAFREIAVSSGEAPRRTPATVVAATSGIPVRGGARLGVATDLPARLTIELSRSPRFRRPRRLKGVRTGAFQAAIVKAGRLRPGREVWWRARVRRAGIERVGPARRFRALPKPGDRAPVRLAVGACASQFGRNFDLIAERRPDVFVWHGDLNYPDTMGPLSQTMSGYGGIWRDFLRNPRIAPILERALFAPQRDDHDYGLQDANSTDFQPFGVAPWDALVNSRLYYRFSAGLADVWVLDERRFKSAPNLPDTTAKTLLGEHQRGWLMATMAESKAPFKIVCSPCTLYYGTNSRDGNWSDVFTAERDLLLRHIREHVSGQTVFLTGDTHDTMVYDRDGVFEVRACPLGIPDPRDHPGVQSGMTGAPGVAYSNLASHFSVVDVSGSRTRARMEITVVREDGAEPYKHAFEAAIRPPRRRRRRRRRHRRRRRRR